jgi:pimeloyl-ACP methyl ester carboxylesterase
MRKLKLLSLIFILWVSLNSCKDDEEITKDKVLIEATSLFTRPASELRTYVSGSGFDLPVSSLEYNVEVFRVTYKTTFKGQTINASGLVILPDTDEAVGMLSFQHGTIAAHDEAPTALPLNSLELILYSALASPGFIAVIPDFLGFGTSSQILHPYYVEDVTALCIIDNLKAARELAQQEGINFNGKLFLAGYSQGGYATMATHKAIEENGVSGFTLKASYPAAGGYDIKGMQETFFSLDQYSQPFYIAYVANAYKETFDWNKPLSDFFQEPYASAIPDLFNGNNSGSDINAALTTNISDLIQPDLLSNIDTDVKYDYIANAFNDNSLLDWTPKIPMHLYHGTADVTVFYQNSVDTYNALLDNGASTSVVTFTALPGATHSTGFAPYIEQVIPKILEQQ